MADIRHRLVIKTEPEKVYEAITTQQGLEAGGVNKLLLNLKLDL